MTFVELQSGGGEALLELRGEWQARNLSQIRAELASLSLPDTAELVVDPSPAQLDLAGSWALHEFLAGLAGRGTQARFRGEPPDSLRLITKTLEEKPGGQGNAAPAEEETFLHRIGRTTVRRAVDARGGLAFTGWVAVAMLRAVTSWKRLRPVSIARHIYDTGITAMPIVSLIAFLMSVIVAYLGAQQLQQFGAEVFVVDLVTVGVLREMGVLLTAIIVAGRSGSAFAAEIGAMKLNEEVDALAATGVDPVETLVLPRIIGLIIALPLLTFLADVVGILGGALLCYGLLDMPVVQYLQRAQDAIAPTTFWVGMWKAPVFALVIALAGTYRGMQVRDSSRELGRLTTIAVVQAIFMVLLADALFAILFMELGV